MTVLAASKARMKGGAARPRTIADAIEACTMKGVTELPPVEGRVYRAFIVSPRQPRFEKDGSQGPVSLAIAHFDSDRRLYVNDLAMHDLTVAEAADHLKRYGIAAVTGLESDAYDETGLAEAVSGVIAMLAREHPL